MCLCGIRGADQSPVKWGNLKGVLRSTSPTSPARLHNVAEDVFDKLKCCPDTGHSNSCGNYRSASVSLVSQHAASGCHYWWAGNHFYSLYMRVSSGANSCEHLLCLPYIILPLTFANMILVFATSRGVVTAAANPPVHIKNILNAQVRQCLPYDMVFYDFLFCNSS